MVILIYHDILGISESASVADINHAYLEKKKFLTGNCELLGSSQLEKKLNELTAAKDACLSWQSKGLCSKTAEKVAKYSSDIFFSKHTNSKICFGPCTFFDCACTCNSSVDSFLVSYCGFGSAWPAILGDIIIYSVMGVSALVSHNAARQQERAKQAKEAHDKMILETETKISILKEQLVDAENQAAQLERDLELAEKNSAEINRFALFYKVFGCTYSFDPVMNISEEKVVAAKKGKEQAALKEKAIRENIAKLSVKLM